MRLVELGAKSGRVAASPGPLRLVPSGQVELGAVSSPVRSRWDVLWLV